jgi:hypothetical protein
MAYYTHSTPKCQVKNTWLQINFVKEITDTLGNILPYPHEHYVNDGIYTYCWLIDGFFDTKLGYAYLNDIIARFLLTYDGCSYKNHYTDTKSTIKPLKLVAFNNLQSKANELVKDFKQSKAETMYMCRDTVFWHLKLYAEDLIRQDGMIIYSKLEDMALECYPNHKKGISTLKAKCRSIWQWYLERDWKTGRKTRVYQTKEELMASRQANMKKINKERSDSARRVVFSVLTGLYAHEYKRPNGDWNKAKIAKEYNLNRNTVSKYVKEFKETSKNPDNSN